MDHTIRVWVSGSLAYDRIMDYPGRFADHINPKKIHVLSLSFSVPSLKVSFGGTAGNIAYNLSLLDVPSAIVGNLGADGKDYLRYLKKLGIDAVHIKIVNHSQTAGAYIITDKDDNQITGFHAGAMNDHRNKEPKVKKGDWAIIAAENSKNMIKLVRHYMTKGVKYIFDPGQQITALTKKEMRTAIRGAKVLIGNDYEIGLVSKVLTPSSSPPSLREGEKVKESFSSMIRGRVRGGGLTVIRTLGPKGSEIFAGGQKIRIGIAKPRRALDPTGAGDAYRAGLIKGIIMGYDWKTSGKLASIVAVYAVEKYGTQNHKFTWEGVKRRYYKNFREKLS